MTKREKKIAKTAIVSTDTPVNVHTLYITQNAYIQCLLDFQSLFLT